MHYVGERRYEARMMCADVVELLWHDDSGQRHSTMALLEISLPPAPVCN